MTNHNVFKDDFTPAEEEVLRLIVKGYSNKEIRDKLFKSSGTLKKQINSIYAKSGITQDYCTEYSAQRVKLVLKYQDKYSGGQNEYNRGFIDGLKRANSIIQDLIKLHEEK